MTNAKNEAPVAETAGEAADLRSLVAHVIAFEAYRTAGNQSLPLQWALDSADNDWQTELDMADEYLALRPSLYASPVPAQDDDKLRTLDVTEDEVAVLLEVMAYAGDEVANAGAANSLFLKAEALSVGLKSTAAQDGGSK